METIGSKRSYALIWCTPNNDDDDDVITSTVMDTCNNLVMYFSSNS